MVKSVKIKTWRSTREVHTKLSAKVFRAETLYTYRVFLPVGCSWRRWLWTYLSQDVVILNDRLVFSPGTKHALVWLINVVKSHQEKPAGSRSVAHLFLRFMHQAAENSPATTDLTKKKWYRAKSICWRIPHRFIVLHCVLALYCAPSFVRVIVALFPKHNENLLYCWFSRKALSKCTRI